MNMELSMALAVMAGCIAFVTWVTNVFGVISPWSWVDLSWSWIVVGMLGASWVLGSHSPWIAVGILLYGGLTAVRTYVRVWSDREAARGP